VDDEPVTLLDAKLGAEGSLILDRVVNVGRFVNLDFNRPVS